jgi:DNA invertase Pin-like site-specific DNA recombinase
MRDAIYGVVEQAVKAEDGCRVAKLLEMARASSKAVRSGIAAARKRGIVFGRRPGQRVKADRYAPRVLKLVGEGQSYREISHRLGLNENTALDIVKRDRAAR